jgi:hypothetical protein
VSRTQAVAQSQGYSVPSIGKRCGGADGNRGWLPSVQQVWGAGLGCPVASGRLELWSECCCKCWCGAQELEQRVRLQDSREA